MSVDEKQGKYEHLGQKGNVCIKKINIDREK